MVFTNVYNPRSKVSRKDEYMSTVVKKGATLGANCTVICGVKIGRYAFIGAGSVVTKNVKNFALVVGVPARQIGWISEHGDRLKFPIKGKNKISVSICQKTGDTYNLSGDNVEKVSKKI